MYAIAFILACFAGLGMITTYDFIRDLIAYIRRKKRKKRIRQKRGVII